MDMTRTLYVKTAPEWRAWLEQNHQSVSEVWLIFFKAHTGQPCISYEDSLDEALCFGWIDSIIQKIDEDRYGRKFTPRKNTGNWSEVNKKKVAKLIQERRMTEAGLAKLGDTTAWDGAAVQKPKEIVIPEQVEQALKASPKAWENFCNMAPSYRRVYIGWITSAKRQETLERRLREAVIRLEQNLPLGMK